MIWNCKSKGRLNNILNHILIYNKDKLEQLISICPLDTKNIYRDLVSRFTRINNYVMHIL